ncbi:putative quinol monooxygenase [Microbacterium aurantiacum]|uniref:putative quinol monooxygenase n=1 Tax=Microbacterium aurantiacum TaxID=162393 RepID=UPI0034406A09
MSQVRVSGHLIAENAEQARIIRAHLAVHIELTRAEAGCLKFDVEPTDDDLAWTVEEVFSDEEAFASHQRRAASSQWGLATAGIERRYVVCTRPADPEN